MKKLALAVIAAAVAVTFALPSFADDAKAEKPKPHQFTGEITAIDTTAKTVTVKNDKGESKTFTLAATVKIATADKKAAELTDLKVGDKIHTVYTEDGGKDVASKIGPPAAPKEKKKSS